LSGRAAFKRKLAKNANLRVDLLPYDPRVLSWLKSQKGESRRIVLATGADEEIATRVAEFIGVFDGVYASDGRINLTGRRKLARLEQMFPDGFDYAGDSVVDIPIWARAQHAVLVNPSASTLRSARRSAPVAQVFERERGPVRTWVRALRLHQWVKNFLVF